MVVGVQGVQLVMIVCTVRYSGGRVDRVDKCDIGLVFPYIIIIAYPVHNVKR